MLIYVSSIVEGVAQSQLDNTIPDILQMYNVNEQQNVSSLSKTGRRKTITEASCELGNNS